MNTDVYRKRYRSQFANLKSVEETDSIPLSDLRHRLLNQKGSLELTADQIDVLLAEADKNGDQRINMEEFEQLVTSEAAQSSKIKRLLYTVADQVITPSQRVSVHSYIDEYTLCPPPVFILFISLIEIAVFFYYYYTTDYVDDKKHDIWTACAGCLKKNHTPGIFLFVPKLRAEAWRFFSYAFLHAGLQHLIGNIVIQLLIGIPLEVAHKMWRIAPLYILAVIAGALLQYTMDPSVLLVGASAGVYALLTAHLANVFLNWSEMPFRWVRASILFVFLTFDIGGAIYRRLYVDQCDLVSHSAHIAGGITGFCFGVYILYNIVDHLYEKIVRYLCLALFLTMFIGTVFLAIFKSPESSPLWASPNC